MKKNRDIIYTNGMGNLAILLTAFLLRGEFFPEALANSFPLKGVSNSQPILIAKYFCRSRCGYSSCVCDNSRDYTVARYYATFWDPISNRLYKGRVTIEPAEFLDIFPNPTATLTPAILPPTP